MWTLVEHYGLSGTAIAGLLAAAWFSPVFKKDLLWAAAVVAVGTALYTWGVRDEKAARDAQQLKERQEINRAVKDAFTDKKKDPYDDPHN